MSANFGQMAGAGMNPMMMMQQQQQQQQQQAQQQQNGGNPHLQNYIVQHLTVQTAPPSGWRINVPINERYGHVFTM